MKIAIDFDDVLMECNGQLARFHNARYGTSYSASDVPSFYLHDFWGVTFDESVRRIREFLYSDAHDEAAPVVGSVEAVRQLARNHELHIVTSREPGLIEKTSRWISKNFGDGLFTELHFTGSMDGSHMSKADACLKIGASYLIDDAPHHAKEVSNAGIKVLLFDCPWNRGEVIGDKVIRVYSWSDVLNQLS